jgi:hypothetical protein
MCLVFAGVPTEKEGIGYKFCRKEYILVNFKTMKEEAIYHPEWRYFDANGRGGVGSSLAGEEDVIEDNTIYKIGEKYVVDHNREAKDSEGNYYRAGVHLYKEEPDFHYLTSLVTLRCKYEKAVAEDHGTVVAMEITPLEEVEHEVDDEVIER